MKIVIVGAGISGLSTYLFLRKHLPDFNSHTVHIIEAYDTSRLPSSTTQYAAELNPSTETVTSVSGMPAFDPDQPTASTQFAAVVVGSALGISKNGLNVLSRIDADGSTRTLDSIIARGHLITKWDIGSWRGWHLADMVLVPDPVNGKEQPHSDLGPALMIVRQALWECFRDAVKQIGGKVETKRLKNIVVDESGKAKHALTVQYADGTSEPADLVIGADGLRSTVRKLMFEKEKKDYITPHYEGLAGVGGWLPSSVLEDTSLKPGVMSITFGRNGFFGCGFMTPTASSSSSSTSPSTKPSQAIGPAAGWWSTYPRPSPPPPANPDQPFDRVAAKRSLISRHQGWRRVSHIRATLDYIASRPESDGAGLINAEFGTYTTPPLPTFSTNGGRTIVLGDAAHALQPSSGQGACLALEDAESFVLLLKHYYTAARRDGAKNNNKNNNNNPTTSSSLITTRETPPRTKEEGRVTDEESSPWLSGVLSQTGTAFTKLRKPRIDKIYDRSQKMGSMKSDLSLAFEFFMYLMIWAMSWFKDTYNVELMTYDVPTEVEKIITTRH